MGRGKIEIKRIENNTSRQVTFSKRRSGLMKKAEEISILCDAKVSVIIVAPNSSKMYNSADPHKMSLILEDYHKNSGQRLWDAKHEDLSNEIERVKKENENMNIELKHFKGEDIQSLNHRDMIALEDLLENGLACIREKKNEFVRRVRERRDIVEAENARLTYRLAEMEMQGSNIMPFSFRVQPMQPNLQDRM